MYWFGDLVGFYQCDVNLDMLKKNQSQLRNCFQ